MVYNKTYIRSVLRGVEGLNIAIVYSTRGGTARECAELLKRELDNFSVKLFELGKCEPDLSAFDLCVIGFPIRMAKAEKLSRNYIKAHSDELKRMKTAYVIVCGFVDCFDEYAERVIPADLREPAVAISCFGGSLDPKRVSGIDRMIVKAVRADILGGGDNADQRKDISLPTVLEANIAQFANVIKSIAAN